MQSHATLFLGLMNKCIIESTTFIQLNHHCLSLKLFKILPKTYFTGRGQPFILSLNKLQSREASVSAIYALTDS